MEAVSNAGMVLGGACSVWSSCLGGSGQFCGSGHASDSFSFALYFDVGAPVPKKLAGSLPPACPEG